MEALRLKTLPLHDFFTLQMFPRMDNSTFQLMIQALKFETKQMYERNTHRGCTNPGASNYNPRVSLRHHNQTSDSVNCAAQFKKSYVLIWSGNRQRVCA